MSDAEPSFEHKFVFARCHQPVVMDLLRHALKPDPAFREGRISSIYYDTPTLELYHEKRASTYLKKKIRVRWYGDATRSTTPKVNCYLELKTKVGGTRQKERFPLTLPAALLGAKDLTAPLLARIPEMLPMFGHSFDGALAPMLVVQYQRQRLVDPESGSRVAVDSEICCPAVNRIFVPAFPPVFLGMCVLEIKGSQREPPPWLYSIRDYVRRDAFSKYASCFEHLLQPAGRRE
ncbi:MAG: polyphosphate polymerase domain-containing protein [Steroidobacter sp.]